MMTTVYLSCVLMFVSLVVYLPTVSFRWDGTSLTQLALQHDVKYFIVCIYVGIPYIAEKTDRTAERPSDRARKSFKLFFLFLFFLFAV